jgi:hypothetical protein
VTGKAQVRMTSTFEEDVLASIAPTNDMVGGPEEFKTQRAGYGARVWGFHVCLKDLTHFISLEKQALAILKQ